MYRIKPYTSISRNRDLFDVFDDFFSSSRTQSSNLKIDVQDFETEYIIEADVPGIKKEELQIHFENERLQISIYKEESDENENDNYIHRERYVESLNRSVYLKDVDPKQFKASLEDGVLKIVAQKQKDKINKYMIEID